MKYWGGYVTAAIFAALTVVLMQMGQRFAVLVDMVYPYVIRTMQTMLAEWSAGTDLLLWQVGAVVLIVVALASIVAMIILRWNPIRWFGWVLAVCSLVYMCHTIVYGMNYYAGPLAEDIRLETVEYTVEELTEAAEYYRDKANELATQVKRDAKGSVDFADFDTLAQQAGAGFENLTYEYSFPIYAGSTLPVKELGWADMYTSMGITGIFIGLTGEAAVNPQLPDASLPLTMCHEMSHRMCIATERDANFSGFLACMANDSVEFQYSAYFMAYRYCYSALAGVSHPSAAAAAARVQQGVSRQLQQDMDYYSQFFRSKENKAATKMADTMNDTYLKTSGDAGGIASYGQVCDLLVSWHIQTVVLPSIAVEESKFDPYDESQIDLSGIVNAR